MKTFALYVAVFVSGASVLALEILGTRLLGPFYGVSLFLWSALITVTLAALSLGYVVGGRVADRAARLSRLGLLMAVAGLWVLAVPWLRTPLLRVTEPLGLRPAVLLAALVLFGPPLTVLGMISPIAIRLKARSLSEVGRTAGDLYAISTVASVVAALATGFVLIPNFGVARLTWCIGLALLTAAALVAAVGRDHPALGVGAIVLLAVGGLAGGRALAVGAHAAARTGGMVGVLVHQEDSAYSEIRVIDALDDRHLVLDGGLHTIVDAPSGAPMHRYVHAVNLTRFMFASPGRALVVGLGGGSIVDELHREGWQVDAVEIDPKVVRVARQLFDLRPEAAAIYVMDGRRFLRQHSGPYQLIVLDAFGSSSIPFHLITREFFALAASRLTPDGILALNVESIGWEDVLVRSIAATLRTQFAQVMALPTGEPPNALGNAVLLASPRAMEVPEEALRQPFDYLADPPTHFAVVQENHAWDNRYVPRAEGARVLTDDRNPADLWAERINRVARRQLHDYFAKRAASW